MKKVALLVSLIALILVFTGITQAGETTGTLEVSANVVGVCTVSTSPVSFGDVTGTASTYANGDVTVNCPDGQAYNIALDAGLHYDGSFRYIMSGTTYEAHYELWKTSTSGTEWGDSDYANTYSWGTSVADTGTGSNQPHTVYGVLFAFTGVPPGTTLTDTVNVTVHY